MSRKWKDKSGEETRMEATWGMQCLRSSGELMRLYDFSKWSFITQERKIQTTVNWGWMLSEETENPNWNLENYFQMLSIKKKAKTRVVFGMWDSDLIFIGSLLIFIWCSSFTNYCGASLIEFFFSFEYYH